MAQEVVGEGKYAEDQRAEAGDLDCISFLFVSLAGFGEDYCKGRGEEEEFEVAIEVNLVKSGCGDKGDDT